MNVTYRGCTIFLASSYWLLRKRSTENLASSKASPKGISAESDELPESLFLLLFGNLNRLLDVDPVDDAGEVDPERDEVDGGGGGSRNMLLFSLLFEGGRSSTASSNTFKDTSSEKKEAN